jgi:hypothetical protein
MQHVSDNPYQAPAVQDVVAPSAPSTDAEAIRNQHLKHEASLKAAGLLYLIGGVIVALSVVGLLAGGETLGARSEGAANVYWLTTGALVTVCVVQFVASWGLRRLRPWSKIPASLLAALSFTRFPVSTLAGALGMLFGVYVLYLLFCAKGRTVLSPAYGEIVAQTPHLRYRTPRWIWITLLVIVLLLFGVAIFGASGR